MIELVFATNNKHKLQEIKAVVGDKFNILSLAEIGCTKDIPETADALEGNASIKSRYVFDNYGKNCFADDTGLEIEALDGKPGVYSARYAGPGHDHQKNMDKVLNELRNQNNRAAQFRTVICLIIDGKEMFFDGIVKGTILTEKHGDKGFGYDPIFQPEGYDVSFAEMDLEAKNKISHRGRAVQKLIEYLKLL
ncbi:MAG: non-canonical purine NTP diphosphatase [Bacteroidales bacterium]|nr:non-canonical purine NTP diphosphatase [Bacteroidales bacterium]MCF8402788.1 non-canonical purine NTP diphosphatase [Bacteroidales bacterium]